MRPGLSLTFDLGTHQTRRKRTRAPIQTLNYYFSRVVSRTASLPISLFRFVRVTVVWSRNTNVNDCAIFDLNSTR